MVIVEGVFGKLDFLFIFLVGAISVEVLWMFFIKFNGIIIYYIFYMFDGKKNKIKGLLLKVRGRNSNV